MPCWCCLVPKDDLGNVDLIFLDLVGIEERWISYIEDMKLHEWWRNWVMPPRIHNYWYQKRQTLGRYLWNTLASLHSPKVDYHSISSLSIHIFTYLLILPIQNWQARGREFEILLNTIVNSLSTYVFTVVSTLHGGTSNTYGYLNTVIYWTWCWHYPSITLHALAGMSHAWGLDR